mmetsp:Transcript_218/g.557  ORF Transcript_218/g.557 Transcript_218/m.557 type:complete len:331 (+) Transcript_218:270-1262(+)
MLRHRGQAARPQQPLWSLRLPTANVCRKAEASAPTLRRTGPALTRAQRATATSQFCDAQAQTRKKENPQNTAGLLQMIWLTAGQQHSDRTDPPSTAQRRTSPNPPLLAKGCGLLRLQLLPLVQLQVPGEAEMAMQALLLVLATLRPPVPPAGLALLVGVTLGAQRLRGLPDLQGWDPLLGALLAALLRLPLALAVVQQPRRGGAQPTSPPGEAAEVLLAIAIEAVDEGMLHPGCRSFAQQLLGAGQREDRCDRVAGGRGASRGAWRARGAARGACRRGLAVVPALAGCAGHDGGLLGKLHGSKDRGHSLLVQRVLLPALVAVQVYICLVP